MRRSPCGSVTAQILAAVRTAAGSRSQATHGTTWKCLPPCGGSGGGGGGCDVLHIKLIIKIIKVRMRPPPLHELSDVLPPSGFLLRCGCRCKPAALYCVPMFKHGGGRHGAWAHVLSLGRASSPLPLSLSRSLFLSLPHCLSAARPSRAARRRLIEEPLGSLSSLIMGPVSRLLWTPQRQPARRENTGPPPPPASPQDQRLSRLRWRGEKILV